MAVTTTPAFAQTPKTYSCIVTAATTVLATTTNHVLLMSPVLTNGGMLVRAWVMPIATNSLSQVVLFRSPDGGTTRYLVGSIAVPAYTLATTTAVPITDFDWTYGKPLMLGVADTLYAAAGVATGAFHVSADVMAF